VTIDEYIDAVKDRLLSDGIVVSFRVIRERATLIDGHLRVRVDLAGGDRLDFSEYVRRTPSDEIIVATYSYHWTDADQRPIRRWDNAFHHPSLPNFPYHVHIGVDEAVQSSESVDIFVVLDTIRESIGAL